MNIKKLLCIVLFFVTTCANAQKMTKDEVLQKLATAAVLPVATCPHFEGATAAMKYDETVAKWHTDTVTYTVSSYLTLTDTAVTDALIERAFNALHGATGIVFVKRTGNVDIEVFHDWGDGRGGVLGVSQFPSTQRLLKKKVIVLFDRYDLEQFAGFDALTIYLHEFGHAVGLQHLDDVRALMFWQYTKAFEAYSEQDEFALRYRYSHRLPFKSGKHKFIYVNKDDASKINDYFERNEFATKCGELDGAWLDSTLIEAVTYIRTRYDCAIKITSSFRSKPCNAACNGAKMSQHLHANAIDFKFVGDNAHRATASYLRNVERGDGCMQALLEMGVSGFGCYPNRVCHIDTRDDAANGTKTAHGYRYVFWRSWHGNGKRNGKFTGNGTEND